MASVIDVGSSDTGSNPPQNLKICLENSLERGGGGLSILKNEDCVKRSERFSIERWKDGWWNFLAWNNFCSLLQFYIFTTLGEKWCRNGNGRKTPCLKMCEWVRTLTHTHAYVGVPICVRVWVLLNRWVSFQKCVRAITCAGNCEHEKVCECVYVLLSLMSFRISMCVWKKVLECANMGWRKVWVCVCVGGWVCWWVSEFPCVTVCVCWKKEIGRKREK